MRFFRVKSDSNSRYSTGLVIGSPFEDIYCDVCGNTRTKLSFGEPEPKYDVVLTKKSRFPDFIKVTLQWFISDYALEVLLLTQDDSFHVSKASIVSASSVPDHYIREFREDGYRQLVETPPRYHMLHIDGRAHVLLEESSRELVASCNTCGYTKYKDKPGAGVNPPMVLDRSSWKGSTLFTAPETGYVLFCTQGFVDSCVQSKLTGLRFEEVISK